jgi:tripartite-type tricarboxylate transporter receptor subunit TctC
LNWNRRHAARALVAALGLFVLGTGSAMAEYPDRPVKIIAPFPPAGGVDSMARVIGNALGDALGQSFVVENHAGASGRIGTELAAKAAPDGYTLLLGSVGPNAIVPAAYRDLGYDAVKSFTPISLIGTSAYALVVPASLPVKSVPELIALAKSKPGKLNFASTGNLGGPHLAGELFKSLAGIDVVHVPYKGGAPEIQALLTGEVAFAFTSLPTVAPHVKVGKVRVLAVTGDERAPSLPDVPTMAEYLQGYTVVQWYGLMAPAGTPDDIVRKLHAAMVKAVAVPKVHDSLVRFDAQPTTDTPEAFAALVSSELAKYRRVIEKAGIHPE